MAVAVAAAVEIIAVVLVVAAMEVVVAAAKAFAEVAEKKLLEWIVEQETKISVLRPVSML